MRWITCFFLFYSYWSLSAQDAPRIRNFLPADYHGQNQNWALTQSPSGWIYAGNNGGLLEFDGSKWQTFNLPENQTVRAVAAGQGDRIYCGGFAEFGFWQPDARGQLAYYSLSREVRAELLDKEEIWHILPTPGFVLFQSFSTIYKYDFQSYGAQAAQFDRVYPSRGGPGADAGDRKNLWIVTGQYVPVYGRHRNTRRRDHPVSWRPTNRAVCGSVRRTTVFISGKTANASPGPIR
ncbi:MAG: hypothetical protein IPM81_16600 [Saprospirales bacterium]|nr:hypothetical protein [Saprospirales bacterium]